MNHDDVLEKLRRVFADVFGRPIQLTRQTSAPDVAGWDSLQQVMLLIAIEAAFNLRFKLGEVEKTRNIGDMVDLLVSKTN